MKMVDGDNLKYSEIDSINSLNGKHTNILITKLNLPLYKPCRCKFCYKDVSIQCVNLMRDACVSVTKDILVPTVATRSFLVNTEKSPKHTKDKGVNPQFYPKREKQIRENSTQTKIIKNKDIEMIMNIFDELHNLKNITNKHSAENLDSKKKPDQLKTKSNTKEIRIHKNKTKLKTNTIKDIGNQPIICEPRKIGDCLDSKKVIDDKKKMKKDDLQSSKNLCGQVTISISRTKDFPEIRFQILSGLGTNRMESKRSNDTEKEKVISTFNYVQSAT